MCVYAGQKCTLFERRALDQEGNLLEVSLCLGPSEEWKRHGHLQSMYSTQERERHKRFSL